MIKKLETALSKLILYFPFLGYYTSNWKIEENNEKVPTMGTDYEHLYYNTKYCDSINIEELCGVLIHECVHNIFLHPSIVSKHLETNKNKYLWTIALEMVTNAESLKIMKSLDCGFSLPGEPLSPFAPEKVIKEVMGKKIYWYDSNCDHEDAIEIYEKLLKKFERTVVVVEQPSHCTSGQDSSPSSEEQEVTCPDCGHKIGSQDKKCPNCGAKVIRIPASQLSGDIVPCEDKNKRQEAIEKAIGVCEKMKKQIGFLPSGIERHIKKLKSAQVPWTRVLMSFLGNVVSGSEEYRWEKPNHRHPMSREIIAPGLIDVDLDDIVFVVDTSGSMSDGQLTQIASELAKIQSLISELVVLTTDAKVHEKIKSRNLPELFKKLKFKGGGGTNFNPIFKEIKKCQCMIFFSDGIATYPDTAPKYPVLWILTKENQTPPFGKVAYVLDV